MFDNTTTSRLSRLALAGGVALVLGACGLALAGSSGGDPETASSQPPPTTVVDTPESTTTAPPVKDAGVVAVPDLSGLTLADARRVSAESGLEVLALPAAVDSAVVGAQEPAPGTEVGEGSTVTVDLQLVPTCNPPDPVAPGIGQVIISVLFECDSDGVFPTAGIGVPRIVPEGTGEAIDRIEWTLRSLLAGPTDDERVAGFDSFFSAKSSAALNGVTLLDGHVVADFNDAIIVNNMNTSTGSVYFNAELRRNVFQYADVDSLEFRFNGDCEAWSSLFESDGCWVISRTDWERDLTEWDDLRNQ